MWNCTHFRHPTDEQLGHVDIFFSNYYNLQSVYFKLCIYVFVHFTVLLISLLPFPLLDTFGRSVHEVPLGAFCAQQPPHLARREYLENKMS